MSSMYPLLTKCVILAKYWLWLPDDGFLVNRNMLEQFHLLYFPAYSARIIYTKKGIGKYGIMY